MASTLFLFCKTHSQRLSLACILGIILVFPFSLAAQCTFNSTSGYSVVVNATPVELNVSTTSCPWGFNYSVDMAIDVSFTGSNAPSSLWNLQGTLYCGSTSLTFNMNNSGGIDTVTTAGSYRNVSDCATATPTSIGCDSVRVTISGPNLSSTTSDCPIPSPVPVEFVSITLEEYETNKILIWTTASELNNHYFTVEMLNSDFNWVAIGEVMGSGTTNSIRQYSFIIPKHIKAEAFRVKQTDYDGTFDYSDVVTNRNSYSDINVYPNPVRDELNIIGLQSRNPSIVVYNNLGYVQEEISIKSTTLRSKSINVSELKPGLYILETDSKRTKFIID